MKKSEGRLVRSPNSKLDGILKKKSKPRPPFWSGRTEVCRYNYRDENGNVAFYKTRYALDPLVWGGRTKDFRCYTPSPVNPSLVSPGAPKGADYLYRLPELLAGPRRNGKACLSFVEGEKDADALIEAGEWATTTHTGALRCSPEQASWAVRALKAAVNRGGSPSVLVWVDKDWPSVTGDPHSDPRVGAYGAVLRHDALREAGWSGPVVFVRARGPRAKDPFDHLAAGFSPVVHGAEGPVLVDVEKLTDLAKAYEESNSGHLGSASQMGYST